MPANPSGSPPDAAAEAASAAQKRKNALIDSFIGHKVSVSTTDLHHVVGRLVAIDEDDRLQILVNNQAVQIRRQGVARIHAADPALAEYVK